MMKPEPSAIRRDWSSGISGRLAAARPGLLVSGAHFVEGWVRKAGDAPFHSSVIEPGAAFA
jgi:hypothetical protein